MPRRLKTPNGRLAALIDEAGCSHKGLAKRVVDLGTVHGLALRYNHSSVDRWVRGEQPKPPVPDLLASVLGSILGRSLAPADLGMDQARGLHDAALQVPATRPTAPCCSAG
jgi:hypothetical protein